MLGSTKMVYETVDIDIYTRIIQDIIAFLEEDEWYAWFQQDEAAAHMAEKTMDVLAEFFKDWITFKGGWPARSPNLVPLDFFLQAYFKKIMFIGINQAQLAN